tara:strand:+ start:509 stop:787 length:279 start_codon:yes stop_codon:yes gene_type:complete
MKDWGNYENGSRISWYGETSPWLLLGIFRYTERFNPSIPLSRKIPSKNSQVAGSRAINVGEAVVKTKVLMKNLVKNVGLCLEPKGNRSDVFS